MKFTILHLSDLHIAPNSNKAPQVLTYMLDDIKNMRDSFKDIVVVVISGDIIDKAKYSSQTMDITIEFFKDLYEIIKDKKCYCEVVPGNHDKILSDSDKKLIECQRSQNGKVSIDHDNWKYHLVSYNKFIELSNAIYDIFGHKHVDNTYYADLIEVENFKLAFINLDTAWSAYGGDEDKGKLRIQSQQLQCIKDDYISKMGGAEKDNVFTICVAHHPLNWLNSVDEKELNNWFLDEEFFNIDAFLCGHTHDRQISNFHNNNNSYITLVTGIGWGNSQPNQHREDRRYSIYNFNTNNNVCEIIIRKTKTNLRFDYDYDILVTDTEQSSRKILLPISPHKIYPYLKIPIYVNKKGQKLDYEYRFVSNDITIKISEVAYVLFDIGCRMQEYLELYIRDFFVKYELNKKSKATSEKFSIYEEYFYKNIKNDEVDALFNSMKNKSVIYNNLSSYLQQLCEYLSLSLLRVFPACEGIRCHFRRLQIDNGKNVKYVTFCQGNNDENSSTHPEIRDVIYSKSLIECSFVSGSPLVFSHNTSYGVLQPKEWQNFITMIPCSEQNRHEMTSSNSSRKNKKRVPLITFAISTKDMNDEMLDILNHLNINDIITSIIENYINLFHITIEDFIKYLKEKSEEDLKVNETIETESN